MKRRSFLRLATATAALPFAPHIAMADNDTYPTRPVRIIVGFAAGGVTDITARLIGQCLSSRLGQPFVIENRPGVQPNQWCEPPQMATPCCNRRDRIVTTRRSTTISTSILFVILHR
jgi:hypothetical protein